MFYYHFPFNFRGWQISEEFPFHTEITSVYAGLRNKLSTPPKRSVSAEVCECTHKFRITNTSVEILKKEIVVFEPIFTLKKNVLLSFPFNFRGWQISEEFPFHTEITSVYAGLRNKLSTPPKRSVSAEVCECTHKFRITNTSVEILKKEISFLSQFSPLKKNVFLPFIHFNALYLSILMRFKAI
jgi:hypothetical protein